MREAVIVASSRTPLAKSYRGSFNMTRPDDLAAHMIALEGNEAAIAGGVESISMVARDNDPNAWVRERYPGIYMVMGQTAELVARRYGVSRERQDEYALLSQQRTARAQAAGLF